MTQRKWWIGALVAVVVSLDAVAIWVDAARRWDEAQQAAVREAALIASISRQALAIQNYQFVEYLFTLWGEEYEDVSRIALVSSNGTIVAEYSRQVSGKNPGIAVQHRVQYGYQPALVIHLTKEGAPVRHAIRKFTSTAIVGSLMLGIAIVLVSFQRLQSRKGVLL